MQLKLFVLPIKNLEAAEAEMNAFLRGHRVLAVKKEFGKRVKPEVGTGVVRSVRCRWHSPGRVANAAA